MSSEVNAETPPTDTPNEGPSQSFPAKQKPIYDEKISRRAKDRLELQQIKKVTENFDKKEAALKIVQARRNEGKSAQNEGKQQQKVNVQQSVMPWVPNPHFMLPSNSVSALPLEDHKRYVAIISNLIKFDKETRFIFNNVELEAMDEKLQAERVKYMDHVRAVFSKKKPYSHVFPGVFKFAKRRFKSKINTVSSKGYNKLIDTVDWKTNERGAAIRANYHKRPKVIESGRQPKLVLPDLTRRCALNPNIAVLSERFPEDSTTKLRDDSTAFDLANSNDVNTILSSCTLRHLLTAPYPIKSYRRAYPVLLKREFVNGKPKRFLILSNPVPISLLSKTEIMKMYGKYMIRECIEKIPAEKKEVKVPTRVIPLKRKIEEDKTDKAESEVKKQKVDETVSIPNKTDEQSASFSDLLNQMGEKPMSPSVQTEQCLDSLDNDDKVGTLEIDDDEDEPNGNTIVAEETNNCPEKNDVDVKIAQPPSTNAGSSVDLLDSIMGHMEMPHVNKTPSTQSPFNYSLLDIDDGYKVLLRSRCHGKDQLRDSPISVTTKIEYVPQCGAETPFEEENMWNFLTAVFSGSDIHVNMHVNIPDAHCLQYSTIKVSKMTEDLKQETQEKLVARWKRVTNLLRNLENMNDGEYLLVEKEDEKLEIWLETGEDDKEGEIEWTRKKIENLSSLDKIESIASESPSFESKFNGLEYHVPLQWHLVKSRIPVSFLPPNPNRNVNRSNDNFHNRGRGRGRGGRGGNRGHFRGNRGRGGNSNDGGRKPPKPYVDYDAAPVQSTNFVPNPSDKIKSLNEFTTDRIY